MYIEVCHETGRLLCSFLHNHHEHSTLHSTPRPLHERIGILVQDRTISLSR
jgi:hypothetical protein